MSCLTDALHACPNIQGRLNDYFETNDALFFAEPMPWAEFLTSPANSSVLTQQIAPGGGKKKSVQVVYEQRALESEVLADQANPNCQSANLGEDCSETYQIDTELNQQYGILMTPDLLRENCESNGDYVNRKIAMAVDAVDRKVATQLTNESAVLMGKWAANVPNVTLDQLAVRTERTGDPESPYPYTHSEISMALRKTGFGQNTVIAGGSTLHSYYENTAFSGCCADSGINLFDQFSRFGRAIMYDRRLEEALPGAENESVALQPGTLAVLHYTQVPWREGMPAGVQEGADYWATTIVSPRLGIPYDVMIKDTCGAGVSVTVTATAKVVSAPDDMFKATDNYEGVKWFADILVDNA